MPLQYFCIPLLCPTFLQSSTLLYHLFVCLMDVLDCHESFAYFKFEKTHLQFFSISLPCVWTGFYVLYYKNMALKLKYVELLKNMPWDLAVFFHSTWHWLVFQRIRWIEREKEPDAWSLRWRHCRLQVSMLKRVWWLVIWGEVRMDHSIYIPLRYWAINHHFHEALHT